MQAGQRLTRREARLLEVMAGEPGRAFTRAELLQRISPDAIVLERTVDAHIKALRRKLASSGARIDTVRGVGYRYAPAT